MQAQLDSRSVADIEKRNRDMFEAYLKASSRLVLGFPGSCCLQVLCALTRSLSCVARTSTTGPKGMIVSRDYDPLQLAATRSVSFRAHLAASCDSTHVVLACGVAVGFVVW